MSSFRTYEAAQAFATASEEELTEALTQARDLADEQTARAIERALYKCMCKGHASFCPLAAGEEGKDQRK